MKRRALPALGLVAGLALIAGWARFVEPDLVRVDHVTARMPGLAPALEPLRVAFVADLHVERAGRRERRLVAKLNALDLDLLLVGGDFVQNAYWMTDYLAHVDEACNVLGRVHTRHGIYGVYGNNDEPEVMTDRLAAAGVRILENTWVALALPGGSLTLAGVGDPVTGHASWHSLFAKPPPEPVLALAHSPDAFPEAASRGLPFLLAGHTHGGQVWHPFIRLAPRLFLRLLPGTPPYRAGLYHEGTSFLYVSRGVGMTHFPLRFLCPPEITVVSLRPR